MFPTAEYVLAGEITDRQQRVAEDFARVGRVRRRRHRSHRAVIRLVDAARTARHTSGRRLRYRSPAPH